MKFSNLVPGTLVFLTLNDKGVRCSFLILGEPDDRLYPVRPNMVDYMCLDEKGNKRIVHLYKQDEEFMTFLPPNQEP